MSSPNRLAICCSHLRASCSGDALLDREQLAKLRHPDPVAGAEVDAA
jgi:hypothetical protein